MANKERMMERKYQIFVSSTYKDLREERRAIIEQILKAGHIPSGMEMFSAGNEEDLKVIQRAIDQCDIYVIILGARFGSVIEDKDKQSFSQIEFKHARETGKPILAFLLKEEEFKEERDMLTSDDEERTFEKELRKFREDVKKIGDRYLFSIDDVSLKDALNEGDVARIVKAFKVKNFFLSSVHKITPEDTRHWIVEDADKAYRIEYDGKQLKIYEKGKRKRRLVDFFRKGDTGDLKSLFLTALNKLIDQSESDMFGWIRGDDDLFRLGLVSKDPFIRKIIEKLTEYDLFTERAITKNPLLKKGMASYFWDRCFASVVDIESGIREIFFESGSTIAYLSSEFSEHLSTPAGQNVIKELHIKTNNILTYFELVLTRNVEIALTPHGPPEKKYGATFGDLTLLPEHPAPGPDPLQEQAKEAIREMAKNIRGDGRKLLLLATASGLNIEQDELPMGPHVGSYYNKLFKRSLLTTECPMVLFIDATKLDPEITPFKKGHCFSVCDSEMPWEKVCKTIPLALCIGAENEQQKEDIINHINSYDFDIIDPVDSTKEYGCSPLLARNKHFNEDLPNQ